MGRHGMEWSGEDGFSWEDACCDMHLLAYIMHHSTSPHRFILLKRNLSTWPLHVFGFTRVEFLSNHHKFPFHVKSCSPRGWGWVTGCKHPLHKLIFNHLLSINPLTEGLEEALHGTLKQDIYQKNVVSCINKSNLCELQYLIIFSNGKNTQNRYEGQRIGESKIYQLKYMSL